MQVQAVSCKCPLPTGSLSPHYLASFYPCSRTHTLCCCLCLSLLVPLEFLPLSHSQACSLFSLGPTRNTIILTWSLHMFKPQSFMQYFYTFCPTFLWTSPHTAQCQRAFVVISGFCDMLDFSPPPRGMESLSLHFFSVPLAIKINLVMAPDSN